MLIKHVRVFDAHVENFILNYTGHLFLLFNSLTTTTKIYIYIFNYLKTCKKTKG